MMKQKRLLCSSIQHINPNVGEIYYNLLNQSDTTAPIACNFISQVVDQWATKSGRLAIRHLDQNTSEPNDITYADLVKRSRQIAKFYEEKGFKKGDKVALILGQRPEWWYGLAGLMRAGIGVVPCPRLLTAKDLEYRINHLNIRGIIAAPDIQDRIDIIRKQCPSLISAITTGEANRNWEPLDRIFNNSVDSYASVQTTSADPCLYLYTSGTTGQPKAVEHNQDYPFFHWPTGRRWLQTTPDDLVYNASDTGWGFTVWITTAVWATGAKLLITPTNKKFDPQKMLRILSEQAVTIFCAAPTVLRLLVAQPNFDSFKFQNLKRIVTVGEALDETVIQRFAAKGIEIAVGFGQAETPLLIGRIDKQPHISGTMGKAIEPYKVVVVDDDLQPLPPGHIGQLAVDLNDGNRNGLMRGYANAPEATQKVFSGRYYLTGDWAEYLPGGFFKYQGRKDDLIKSYGYRIGPDEVEKAGMSHPAVAKIAVIGVPPEHGSLARVVKAIILLKPGYVESSELVKDIQAHIKKETAPYKYPRLIECLSLEEWSKFETISGKIRRVALREREEQRLVKQVIGENELKQSPHSGLGFK